MPQRLDGVQTLLRRKTGRDPDAEDPPAAAPLWAAEDPETRRVGCCHDGVNNRETAAVIWLGVLLLYALSQREIRESFGAVLRSLFAPKLFSMLVAMAAWIVGLIWLAASVGGWRMDQGGDTVAWYFATGCVMFGASVRLFDRDGGVPRMLRRALHVTLVVEAFVNLYVFSLPVEVFLVPVVALFASMSVVAEYQEGVEAAKKLADAAAGLVGVAMVGYVVAKLATDFHDFDQGRGLRAFALPVWLTLGFVPFCVGLGLWSRHEQETIRRKIWQENTAYE